MMQAARNQARSPAPAEPGWNEATIAVEISDGNYLLDDGRVARQAASCLVVAAQGDRVLVAACRQGDNYIVHLLTRAEPDSARLCVPGAQQVNFCQPRISLNASEQLALRSLQDIEVTAAGGTLSLTARNLFSSVSESLVENVRHYVGNVGHYLLDVKQMLRLHGKQASITADNDVKVDAERISMG